MPKIGLFLGAGASKPFGMPTVVEFFNNVNWERDGKQKGYKSATEELARRIWVSREQPGANPFPDFDSEWLFEGLQKIVDIKPLMETNCNMTDVSGLPLSITPQELLSFLKREVVHIFGQQKGGPFLVYLPLIKMLNEEIGLEGSLKIFTTNYDLVVEKVFRDLITKGNDIKYLKIGVQFIDGFKKVSDAEPREWSEKEYKIPPENKLRVELYKLHGSITWKWDMQNKKVVDPGLPQPTGYDWLLYLGYKGVPDLVFGGGDPFWFLYKELANALIKHELFIVIGFRFNDAYIRTLFSMALRANPRLKIIVVIPDRSELSPELYLWHNDPDFCGEGEIDFLEYKFGEKDFAERLLEKIKGGRK